MRQYPSNLLVRVLPPRGSAREETRQACCVCQPSQPGQPWLRQACLLARPARLRCLWGLVCHGTETSKDARCCMIIRSPTPANHVPRGWQNDAGVASVAVRATHSAWLTPMASMCRVLQRGPSGAPFSATGRLTRASSGETGTGFRRPCAARGGTHLWRRMVVAWRRCKAADGPHSPQ